MRNLKKPASLLLMSGVMLANSQALIAYADQKCDSEVNAQHKIQNIVRADEKKANYIDLKVGDNFEPLSRIAVIENVPATSITLIEGEVDTTKVGTYKVVYEINKNIKEIEVIVRSNEKPEIIANDIELKVGDEFNPAIGVSAIDKEDGKIAATRIVVKENTVDTTKAGTYKVVYEVKDKDGNITTKEIKVTVRVGEKPEIIANDIELKVGDEFNPAIGVSAIDKEDGKIPATKIVVKENTVNTTKAGTYKVVYEVTDKDGNTTAKEIKVTVKENAVLNLAAPTNVTLSSSGMFSKKVTVKWNKVSGAYGYEVYRATNESENYEKISTVPFLSSTTDSNVSYGKKYYYKVRAYKFVNNKKVYSQDSAVQSIRVK